MVVREKNLRFRKPLRRQETQVKAKDLESKIQKETLPFRTLRKEEKVEKGDLFTAWHEGETAKDYDSYWPRAFYSTDEEVYPILGMTVRKAEKFYNRKFVVRRPNVTCS